ncbi:hypothetical protein D9756_011317 [Leucocoprinus leucothites]|uniref:Uncharacterized protein n=1 Tax=Leucocoprinus leucothites TaxID=201217 RepID=A0A8H5CN49_9AGAR|nr:hypothetical protein D9756_011317 [Leucoagaricus leucothites]
MCTARSIRFFFEGYVRLRSWQHYWAVYTDRLLPSQQVASSPEIIRRLGAISVNTSLEVNIV